MGVLVMSVTGSGLGLLFMGAFAGGLIAPDYFVSLKARRREKIRADLDALDLLAAASMSVRLRRRTQFIEHMEGPLAEEFGFTLGEMRIGEPMTRSRGCPSARRAELSSFTRAIIQADQLGTSPGRSCESRPPTLHAPSGGCEERPMKALIKMLFPTVLFIFLAMFLIILGPAFLNLDKIF